MVDSLGAACLSVVQASTVQSETEAILADIDAPDAQSRFTALATRARPSVRVCRAAQHGRDRSRLCGREECTHAVSWAAFHSVRSATPRVTFASCAHGTPLGADG